MSLVLPCAGTLYRSFLLHSPLLSPEEGDLYPHHRHLSLDGPKKPHCIMIQPLHCAYFYGAELWRLDLETRRRERKARSVLRFYAYVACSYIVQR